MRRELAVIGVAVVLISSTFGVSAYTTGTLDRQSNVDVVTDSNGLIGLEDGTSGDLVQINNGELGIDFSRPSRADGANVNATFELGNPNDATNQSAFNVTNNDDSVHDLTFNYREDSSDTNDGDENIQFEIYNASGDHKVTATEENSSVTVSDVNGGDTLYVVIVVDTHGLDTSDDLSGTLEIRAN